MSPLLRHAPAKINLYLHITGKRPDGYHLLESLATFADIHDTIQLEKADKLSLSISGPFAPALEGQANLLTDAALLLAAKAGREPNVHISLHKALPIGAGIGGGSADAAALLHLLYTLWELPFSHEEMLSLGLKLGADVPICYHGRTVFFSGIGEKLTPSPAIPALPAVLVNPLIPLATPAVFKHRKGKFSPPNPQLSFPQEREAFISWLKERKNDLVAPATELLPVILKLLGALESQEGCLLARMSGSGATCFGLFKSEKDASSAATAIAQVHPHWWVQAAMLGDTPINS